MDRMEDTKTAARVAESVSMAIESSGVTVTWLCERTGIPRSTLLRRLNGLAPFDLNQLDRIATALRVAPESLFGFENDTAVSA